jgi:phosphoribosylformimino-5-aminoimidazole carboxamide ribonucleotide (ProFAR) isomerase
VTFEVIPAIDVAGGRLARLSPEGPVPLEAHGGDPIAAARACLAAGARRLHVVDMDLAFSGEPRNADVLRAIVGLGALVQAAGAIADDRQVAAALEAGCERVVLGSAALADLDETGRLIERYGERLVIGIEVDGDRVRARGLRATDLPLDETLSAVHAAGAARSVITTVRRVSTMTGPDVVALAVAVGLGLAAIAAGGIASVGDLEAVRGAGAEGAIVGRAALEGALDLKLAISSVV